jgi:tetratricopeptide (TPR) repeat protein
LSPQPTSTVAPANVRASSSETGRSVWGVPLPYLIVALLALTAVGYVSTLAFQFVYDDEAQIVGNVLIEKWRYVPYYFNMQVWAHVNPHQAGNYYRPVFMLWMRLNHALFEFHAFGWHLVSALMHLLATYLVFKFARRLSKRDDIAFVTALIFGLHPVHVEAVAWVSGATESLLTILLIPSFLWFLEWREGHKNARTYSLLFFALAIFSKETAVLMLPLVFIYEWLNPREQTNSFFRHFWKSLLPALPFLGITLGYLYLRLQALHALSYVIFPVDWRTNLLTIPSILWFYCKLLFWPVGLSAFYDIGYVTQPTLRQFWLPLLGISVITGTLLYWYWKTRDRLIAFASMLLVLPLIPLMKLSVFAEGEIAHDRYLYLPSFGFALLIATALVRLAPSQNAASGRKVLAAASAIGAVFLGLTMWQSMYWANNMVLYYRGTEIAPNNNLALNNLANELERRQMYKQAIAVYEKVLSRSPTFYYSNYNLGYVFFEDGQFEQGAHFLRRAASLFPNDAGTYYYLAQCEMKLGQTESAEANLHRAIMVDPRLLGPRYMLGVLLKQQGRNKEALDYFRAELSKNPQDAKARAEVEALAGK